MVAKAPIVVGDSLVSMRMSLSESEVICLGLRKQRHKNMRCSLRGSKAHLVSDVEAVLHGWMAGISVRCILDISNGETESTFDGVSKGAGLVCLDGGVYEGAGRVSLVGG